MIVRTYGRRKSGLTRSYSDSDFNEDVGFDDSLNFRESLSQEASYSVGFSSQDSTTWNFDSEIYGSQQSLSLLPPKIPESLSQGDTRKSKKPRKNLKRELKQFGDVKPSNSKGAGVRSFSTLTTSTLMEAQESGEMMEHVDEVSYALDGLRKGQPSRIRRASLLALLTICATASQRRLLRTQGMAKTIIDSILALSFDDSPSNLAAAALFYILASDGQDDQLLDSPVCIRFLLNLLRPSTRVKIEDKLPTFGSKLLELHRNTVTLEDRTEALDASSTAIISKVQDILLSSQEIESSNRVDDGVGRPELTPKWIALLTMEKACLSTVSLEDTYGTFGRAGGSFKERLRELGGLDAVFDVARNCYSIMEVWSRKTMPSVRELKDEGALETVVLLLKCLKIMENATFLSKDNQVHLLGMKGKSDFGGSSRSFTNLMISLIRILSGLSLHLNSPIYSHGHASKIMLKEDKHFDMDGILSSSSSGRCCGTDKASQDSFNVSQKFPRLSTSPSVIYVSSSETISRSSGGTSRSSHCGVGSKINGLKMNASLGKRPTVTKTSKCINLDASEDSFAFNETSKLTNGGVGLKVNGLKVSAGQRPSVAKDSECINLDDSEDPFAFNETSSCSNGGVGIKINGLKMSVGLTKRSSVTENVECINLDDSQDPFAFDEEEFKPSKWDKLPKSKVTRTQKSRKSVREFDDVCEPMLISSQSETSREENCHSCEITESPAVEEGNPNLLSDCLLTAVKVLMNLTNDNPLGCQQIAACDGLETLSKLIVGHFPSFTECIYLCKQIKDSNMPQSQKDKHLTDQELDLLVAILGLLVNLVEKDSQNRSRLACTSVSLLTSEESEETETHTDVIPLLCSIFLANQGAGEAAEDGNQLTWSEEAAVQQGEHEAEKMIIEAYAALLLAFLSTESKNVREAISSCLPDHSLEILVPVLERFVAFHLTLNMISPDTHAVVSELIESCRRS
ncbi:hypothetical protein MKW98_023687 [Papaver atlanticum]|uniref:Wings apart-like protein C-terminal domain-containing protein n=1 Tax=Papaver atlanticum TaxID=357466 RepID=A0AAD4XNA9_9MAGN|nr:hypothetical protein MKW98_023687 [Papaver atlanticum]